MINWLYLFTAILFEVVGTTAMKLSSGLAKHWYTAIMLFCYISSLTLLSFVLKHIHIGVAYAIWSGLGIVFISIIGILFFHERLSSHQMIFIALIIIGAIGLNLTTKVH